MNAAPDPDSQQVGNPVPVGWYVQTVSVASGATVPLTFPASIARVFAFVSGFNLTYSGGDHHVQTIAVQAAAKANGSPIVQVSATCEMHDNSGNKATASVPVAVLGLTE